MMRHLKFLLKLLIFTLLLLPYQALMADTPTLEKVTLQLSWKYQFQFAGFIAAKEKGYYKKAGFEVELKEFDTTINILDDIISNRTQFAINPSGLGLLKLQGYPVVLLANYFKRPALVLLTQPDIYTPADLAGKTVIGSKSELLNSNLSALLTRHNVALDSLNFIPSTFNTKAFISGEVNAMTAYLSNEPYYLRKNKVPFNIIDPANYNIAGFSNNLFSALGYVQANPLNVQKFIEASNQGWLYALQHKEEMITLLQSKYPSQKTREALRYEAEVTENLMLLHANEIGSVNKALITENMSHQPLYKKGSLSQFFFNDLLPKTGLLTLKEQQYLANKQRITMCVDPNWMPYEKIEHGKHIGMVAEYFALFEQKLGIPIQLVETDNWPESLTKGIARQCDILSLASKTPERLKHWNFTPPYLSTPLVLTTRMDKPFVNSIDQILHKKLGVGAGYSYGELLRDRYKNIHLLDVSSPANGLTRVLSGELYGYLGALAPTAYLLQNDFTGQLKISGKFIEKLDMSIAVRNDDPVLLEILSKVVSSIPNKTHQEIMNHWISVNIKPKTDYTLLWTVLSLSLLLLTLLSIRLYIQKKYVSQLEEANQKIKQQNQMLESLSTTDALTQLDNRLKLDLVLTENFERFKRYHQVFSVILIDIDHFKNINDTYGHLIGDQVLINLARITKHKIRHADTLGRWGGEEFLIVCPETSEQEAKQVAEKLRLAVFNSLFEQGIHITVSTGVVQMQQDWSIDRLFEYADKALYHSKESGRNKTTTYQELEQELKQELDQK